MAQETEDAEAKSIWLNDTAQVPFQEYKAVLEERANAEQNPSQVVESACKTALEVEG
ncbi:hypothetical protein [Natrialba taiwanensis]|uniref:hypothetical protein n=1 Tax=Natrialba taiwanensis TaxID=160846 RepID=UPI000A7CCE13|nr:hypothetical protein [Natrialba taiwanensis]